VEPLLIDAEQKIRALGHRVTTGRVLTLAMLLAADKPLTHDMMLASFKTPVDRVTLYRTLDWLVHVGLAHRIRAEDRLWRFIAGGGETRHPHFYCENTGKLICLTDVQLPDITLPKQFKVSHVEIVFHGVCEA
jgi:Fur family ferric uptake transcriptional regulator